MTLYDLYGAGSTKACGYGTYTTKIEYGVGSYQYDLGVSKFDLDRSNPADGSITETFTSGFPGSITYTYDSHYYFGCGYNLYPQFSSWQVQKAGGGTYQPQQTGWLIITGRPGVGLKSNITATAVWGPVYVPYMVDLSQMQCVFNANDISNGNDGYYLTGTTITQQGAAAAGTTITSSTWPQSCGYESGPGWFQAGYYIWKGDGYMACVNPVSMTLVANLTYYPQTWYQNYQYWNNQPQATCEPFVNAKTDLPPS